MALDKRKVEVVDLFCGIGGLTHGFIREGFKVVAGIDNDVACKFGYEFNNGGAKFFDKDIVDVTSASLKKLYAQKDGIKVLVGCAPCQPFSGLNPNNVSEQELQPLQKFAQLIEEVKPHVVSMENVRGLIKNPIFAEFLQTLEANGYFCSYGIVDFSDYGVPQKRNRLVLLASRLGQISLISPTHKDKKITVRDVIGKLEPIKEGGISRKDSLHRARSLSPLNKKRIRATPKNGGNSSSWSSDLMLKCHKKKTGKTFKGTVYGRMYWDQPAPTMTTQCTGLGNGRFGHPEQNRAISLREAALFQTFPSDYEFVEPEKKFIAGDISRFIGNAVPVRAGEVIAQSIEKHLVTRST